MSAYFFDSSAIVKRYHWEPGSAWIQAICGSRLGHMLYLSQVAEVEVVAALRRTGRREGLHQSFIDSLVRTYERHLVLSDVARTHRIYRIVPLLPFAVASARALCNTHWDAPHPLRSLDAIQLASARIVAAGTSDEMIFVTSDAGLADIAEREGLRVINPVLPPASNQ